MRQATFAVAVAGLLLAAAAAPAAAQSGTEPATVVSVHEDGTATLTLRLTFDLTTAEERAAFRTIENDTATRENLTRRFGERMRSIAAATENATGRNMSVTAPTLDLRTVDDTGIVTLAVEWTGLAERRDGRLVVTEPFASEFTTDRAFVVRAPEGYRIGNVTPEPAEANATRAAWSAGTDLSGFEAVLVPADATPTASPTATPSPTPTPTPAATSPSPTTAAGATDDATATTDDGAAETPAGESPTATPTDRPTRTGGQPGFGFAAALAALAALALRRRRGA